jgi:hypothetical protein
MYNSCAYGQGLNGADGGLYRNYDTITSTLPGDSVIPSKVHVRLPVLSCRVRWAITITSLTGPMHLLLESLNKRQCVSLLEPVYCGELTSIYMPPSFATRGSYVGPKT